ncbi:hypothetical protein [Numidum massiliense]|uniref:hypothetical protein n=1 Tax=Numidum massiliense TaxID=1522315 RepID=UPI0006D5A4B5|nr:hypothetical protein [Numidum massiliense]
MKKGYTQDERGAAYISVILTISLLFVWLTFQLEQLIQNQQTIAYDEKLVQAQYLAESGIERWRAARRVDDAFAGRLAFHLQTGSVEVKVVRRRPLQVQAIGKVAPDVQQTIVVELDTDTLQTLKWSRRQLP